MDNLFIGPDFSVAFFIRVPFPKGTGPFIKTPLSVRLSARLSPGSILGTVIVRQLYRHCISVAANTTNIRKQKKSNFKGAPIQKFLFCRFYRK